MQINPMIRNNICLNSHPKGCAEATRAQIRYVRKEMSDGPVPAGIPKLVLVVGCSTGYGLASRIAAAFGYGAATVGVSYEKAGSESKAGTPGWYDNLAFDTEAAKEGLAALTLDGDAFSSAMKADAIKAIREVAAKAGIPAKVDLVVYSLASPVRSDPDDGTLYRSVIKPIGKPYAGLAMDVLSGALTEVSVESATDEEISHTVKVMGGEDWALWIEALGEAGVLAPEARTVAYSYIGPELSWGIYKEGTIGRAKEHLDATAKKLDARLRASGGAAWVSVNKALVTRSSAVIPIISLYISSLFKVMKAKGLHEGCIEQIVRLYRHRLYSAAAARDPSKVATDAEGRIRIDDLEMRADVQQETAKLMAEIDEGNLAEKADYAGFRHDFLETHGFDVAGVDYDADVDPSGL
ncbi:MAG TPA: bifunctional NADH-specific enoyl-ACP reductase/trans-2-enoyl-CoA reductase [Treponema sp.]|nr:MAG: trans-2-enoyl-CoA reductase [Treponema sp. GWC1_61_84]OHE76338.1 MAG: trans-2-enoyl-CoA reductase [Treponema sp. RIFOXYC1_FULL_61_9]HCM26718.1 bifunctional NADH-specific enoyl-ACP reductase/trans-2-enoyl-CoA reductase [Treponema sp.]